MAHQRHIFLTLFTLMLAATAAQAQLVFTPDSRDFGTIEEADGHVSHIFTGENRGDKPVVILDVVTSCGCTVPEFSKQPIRPGEKTSIKVTFDPTNRPGAFTKELGVYSSERRKIATLFIRGNVVPRAKSTEELYPVDAGEGLRLSSTLCTFSYIGQGQEVQSAIGYVNTSKRKIRLELLPQAATGLLKVVYPREIAPGETGEINLIYRLPEEKPSYGTLRDVLEVRVDGTANGTKVMAHGIGIDKPLSDPKKAPKAELIENIIKFGPVKHAAGPQQHTFTLSNTGPGELIVRAVETDGKIITTLTPGQRIPAGSSFTAQVTLQPDKQEYGVFTDFVNLITNDPSRPMRRLRVTAIIED